MRVPLPIPLALALAAACPGREEVDAGPDDVDDVDDAGSAPTDAGFTDAGFPCEGVTGPLGSLELADGHAVVDDAALPSTIGAVAAVDEGQDGGAAWRVYGVDTAALAVVDLGTWPALSASPTNVFDVVPADETAAVETIYASSFLSADARFLVAGYSTFSGTGKVAVHDTTTSTTAYFDAPGVFAAALFGDALLVQAFGLDELAGPEADVYGLTGLGTASPSARVVLDFEQDAGIASGVVFTTGDGVPVIGRYQGGNEASAFPAATVAAALSPDGGPIAYASGAAITASPYAIGAGYGTTAAFATIDESFAGTGIVAVPVTTTDGGVTVGAEADVLGVGDGCSRPAYGALAPIGDDLLVGVDHPDERVLLRITRAP